MTQHSLAQTCLKAVIFHEAHNFKMLNRRKEKEREGKKKKNKKTPSPLAENEFSIKVKNKTLRNAMLKMPIRLTAKILFLIKLIFKEQHFKVLK